MLVHDLFYMCGFVFVPFYEMFFTDLKHWLHISQIYLKDVSCIPICDHYSR